MPRRTGLTAAWGRLSRSEPLRRGQKERSWTAFVQEMRETLTLDCPGKRGGRTHGVWPLVVLRRSLRAQHAVSPYKAEPRTVISFLCASVPSPVKIESLCCPLPGVAVGTKCYIAWPRVCAPSASGLRVVMSSVSPTSNSMTAFNSFSLVSLAHSVVMSAESAISKCL